MRIEFVEARLPSRRAWSVVLVIGALAAVAFAASRVMALRARALDASRIVRIVDVPTPATPRAIPAYDAQARRALDRAQIAWSDSLGQLEGVSVDGVELRSIDVDAAAGRVKAELGVSNDHALSDYIDQLNAGLPQPSWIVDSVSTNGSRAASAVFTASPLTATITATFKTTRVD
jgi:hypothetical protein